jgi:hypothetical protein
VPAMKAGWRSGTATARQARARRLAEYEETAAEAWRRLRAQPRRRPRKALPPSQAEPPGAA